LEDQVLMMLRGQVSGIMLGTRKTRFSNVTLPVDPITGLPVLSAGVGAPRLSNRQVREILAEFP
jgi:hypothetical protein